MQPINSIREATGKVVESIETVVMPKSKGKQILDIIEFTDGTRLERILTVVPNTGFKAETEVCS